jgi:acetyltransferase-like isoleucine patch superfamily enzyme
MVVRRVIKKMGMALGVVRAVPAVMAYRLGRTVLGRDQAFSGASERMSLVPGPLGVYARQAFYQWTLASCGQGVYVGLGTLFSKPAASLGRHVYLGRQCIIGWAQIADEAMLGDGVQVLSGRHQHGRAAPQGCWRDNEQTYAMVKIGRGAWIGAGAIVMADVGAGAVVGAAAVVVSPVEPGARVAGVPAKTIGSSGALERSRAA